MELTYPKAWTGSLPLCPLIFSWSKHFTIELREVTFGSHLRKHLRLLVGYCETSVTRSHARLDHNVKSESTWSLETSILQDFSVIEILQNEKYMTKSSKYSTYDLYPTGRFFHYNRNLKPLQNFDRDLDENLGEFLAGEIAEISVRSRRDLKISSRFSLRSWRDLKISAAKNASRFLPRSQNLVDILAEISAAKNLWRISARFQVRSWRDVKVKAAKTSPRITARLQVRSR